MTSDVVVLNSGGLKSLVATATQVSHPGPMLLFVHDGRPSTAEHYHAFLQQAQHFQAARRVEVSMTHLFGNAAMPTNAPLSHLTLISNGVLQAARLGASKLIWPVRVGDDLTLLSIVTEACVLLEHAAEHETGARITIETPLLELTVDQVIEAGAKLGVPWKLGRSCLRRTPMPCGKCEACVARERAFNVLGIEDQSPAVQPS